MEIIKNPPKSEWNGLLKRPMDDPEQIRESVSTILADVKKNGDFAIKKYTRALDGADLESISVSAEKVAQAEKQLNEGLKQAIRQSAANIKKFHEAQDSGDVSVEVQPGLRCWQKAVPIDRIGIYIPGGSAPLFSSVLMLAVPAIAAGCNDIVLVTPPDEQGGVDPAILYAAAQSGVHRIYRIGGAQAVGALAYGTETIPRVDKIFGPGNQFVTLAKQLVSLEGTAIDLPAGPSEVLVVADKTASADYVAADLLSQAEHGADSQVILLSDDEPLIRQTRDALQLLAANHNRSELVEKALDSCRLILLEDKEQMMEMANAYAPEHLIIAVEDAERLASQVRNAGSVFLGHYTPESLGDYASGTNHVLPTNSAAKAYSGVNLDAFRKKITFQQASRQSLEQMGEVVMQMAEAEGLEAHRRAVAIRLNLKKGQK